MSKLLKRLYSIVAVVFAPLTILSAIWLKFIRIKGISVLEEKVLMSIGVFPILDHYYEPLINPKKYLKYDLKNDRNLPGIDLNINYQLTLLDKFDYYDELLEFPLDEEKTGPEFYYNNSTYGPGDAEYLYSIIRLVKPRRIIEIGSGYSTLMAINAIRKNKQENESYSCSHVCIEPYEHSWLNEMDIELKRDLVENIDTSFFENLGPGDILFIDSSHIIRPQGDVLYEILELLPTISSGVLIHIHDIFTPKDYHKEWVLNKHRLWNEQYLLEAFLSNNSKFRIIGALNFLTNSYRDKLDSKFPILASQKERRPGAFWIEKI